MVITRTPYRVSFFGGGTDYPDWYLCHGGQVFSTTINRYCYLTLRDLPPFFAHNMRIVYSKIELCNNIGEIVHPLVRETLRYMNWTGGLELHHDGDLPARSGMGSSSAFTVGLLKGLHALNGTKRSAIQLAHESIHVERNLVGDVVGSQDQSAVACGGLNHISFHANGEIAVRKIALPETRKQELHSHLMLFFTLICRNSSSISEGYQSSPEHGQRLHRIHNMVDEALSILSGHRNIQEFGELLQTAWEEKQGFCTNMAPDEILTGFERARVAGALGGKLLGAGGGGFVLFFVPPHRQSAVQRALEPWLQIPFQFCDEGSQIIFHEASTKVSAKCEEQAPC